MALTPTGPKNPVKKACFQHSTCEIQRYKARTIGSLLSKSTRRPSGRSRLIGTLGVEAKCCHGAMAPNQMKIEILSSISIVGCNESSIVSSLNQSLDNVSAKHRTTCVVLLYRKDIARNKTGKHVVSPNHAAGPNNKELAYH